MAKKKAGKGAGAAGDPAIIPPQMTVLSDAALAPEDYAGAQFDLLSKLGAVYDVLRHPETQTPMAIAVYGDWGTGKSSAMRWLQGMLEKWNKDGADPKKDKVVVRTLWFDPWKYHDREDVWRGLVAEVILKSIDVKTLDAHNAVTRLTSAAKRFGGFLGRGFLQALAGMKFKAGLPGTAGAEVDFAALRDIYDEYRDAVHPEKAYLNEFESAMEDWLGETLGKHERMVIFIDDLDRSLPEVAREVLEALKLYLNLKKLIFVVGVDRSVVDAIIRRHYRRQGVAEDKASRYLDKMFQIEINIVPSEAQVDAFFERQIRALNERTDGYWDGMLQEEHRDVLKPVIRRLCYHNPREVKRLLNSSLTFAAGVARRHGPDVQEAPGPEFAQGVQVFLIWKVLESFHGGAGRLVGTQDGQEFFEEWSQIVCKHPVLRPVAAERDRAADRAYGWDARLRGALRPGDQGERPAGGPETEDFGDMPGPYDGFCGKWALRLGADRVVALLRDPDLFELMKVPFSPQVAAFTESLRSPRAPVGAAAMPDVIAARVAASLRKPVDALTAGDYEEVETLDLSGTQVDDLTPLSGLARLRLLGLAGTPVSGLTPLSGLTALARLGLAGTPVTDLKPLSGLAGLRELYLSATRVSDLTPLSRLTALEGLGLARTPVTDLTPLSGLSGLEWLGLAGTQVSDLTPLSRLTGLTSAWQARRSAT